MICLRLLHFLKIFSIGPKKDISFIISFLDLDFEEFSINADIYCRIKFILNNNNIC